MTSNRQADAFLGQKGLFGLVVSGISATVSITAILTWMHMAESTATIDSGGPAFAANIGPLVNSLLGLTLGVVALLVIGFSIGFSEKRFPKSFTFYQFCSLVFLAPSAYLLSTMFIR